MLAAATMFGPSLVQLARRYRNSAYTLAEMATRILGKAAKYAGAGI